MTEEKTTRPALDPVVRELLQARPVSECEDFETRVEAFEPLAARIRAIVRAEVEDEESGPDPDFDAVMAMPIEQVEAELRSAGINVDRMRENTRTFIRIATDLATLRRAIADWHADEDDDGSRYELVLKLAGVPPLESDNAPRVPS